MTKITENRVYIQKDTHDNDITLTLDELVALCNTESSWIVALIEEDIITPTRPQNTEMLEFSGYQLALVRQALRLQRDFEASVPAIGLILDLLDEVKQLRQFKRQWQGQQSPIDL